ncbi:hypothetical protein OMK68_15530 [Rhodococcus pyridinivorans]|uniref:hypothetical protein n=1 Tax=Rhodococcus pyridinivorans TaxID=103816 RepID=UPI002227D0BE|nr:hypothetical protein [Rhodococcus pyridinivorans]MCW3471041.1 hypothetical protein [Rhodococcus pyridinivorans]
MPEQSLTRWVAQVKKNIPRTKHGLLDSDTLGRDWYEGHRPQLATDLIGTPCSYVLLAPGGAGKTTLIDDLKRQEPDSHSIDLLQHDPQSVVEQIKSLTSNDSSPRSPSIRTVFVDAVDEALQINPSLEYTLEALLRRPESNRLAWRFACRPGSWTVSLAKRLQAALPDLKELELLPLSLTEIGHMAGSDADHFLAAVEHARLTRLLAYPLQARDLLDHWRKSGQLPVSRSEAMQHALTDMLTETNSTRPLGRLDDRRRRLIAERLAATSMFCGVGAFALGPARSRPAASTPPTTETSVSTAVLAVASVPTQDEAGLSQLTVDEIREVLDTALFTAAGQGTVAFVHQSYAEFLAAAYLERRRVAGQRLVSILGADVNGLVPGPMIEVLGWLSASGSSVPDVLIANNAKQLLSTAGLELVDDRVRECVVEALLHGAADGTIDEGWRADTSALSHPGLATQLHQAAQDVSNDWVAFWICRLARHCAVVEAADDLLTIAFLPTLNATMRAEAVKGFAEVAPQDDMGKLVPLLDLNSDEDPHDEILAATLRALLSGAPRLTRIQRALRPRRAPNFFGGYIKLLGELPSLLPPSHVLPVLTDALQRRLERDDSAFDRLIGGLLLRAWDMKDAEMCEAIGAALSSELLSAREVFSRTTPPWLEDNDPKHRHALAASALVSHPNSYYPVLEMRMLTPADLGWLLDWISTAPPEAHKPALVVLQHLAVSDTETPEHIPQVDEDHPAFAMLSNLHVQQNISDLPESMDSPTENHGSLSSPELDSQLRDALTRARSDISMWWDIAVALVGNLESTDYDVLFGWDLTSKPMWSSMTPEEQETCLQLGLDYINSRHPDPDHWSELTGLSLDDVMPDWSGAYLLATLAVHHPDLLADVQPSAWASWSSVLLTMPNVTSDEKWKRQIRNTAPPAGREAIDEALREQIRRVDDNSFAHHPLADFSDTRLITVIEQLARNIDQPEDRRNEAIEVLIEHAPQTVLDVARTAITTETVPSAAFTALAKLAPDELVAEWIAQRKIGPMERLSDLDVARLSDSPLVALTGMLLDELPFAEDPVQSDGFTVGTPESDARRLRMYLLQSMANRGLVSELVSLMEGRPEPDLEQIRYLVQDARAREAVTKWQPVPPNTLMEFLARGDARLVRDSAGLLAVLLEQLEQIQQDIHGRASFRFLWDGEPDVKKGASPKNKDASPKNKDASPKNEDTISDWVAHELRLRLNPHVVLDRELQVTRRSNAGVGTRIDITATSGGVDLGRVIFEAKLVNNPELLTAIDDQLVGQYLTPTGIAHGIYIVYWTTPELRPKSWPKNHTDPNTLAETLREQAQRHRPSKHIEIIVLDIGRPT